VELHDGAWAAIRRREGLVSAGSYVSVEARLAVAEYGGGAVADGRIQRMAEPDAVPGGDQELRVEALERLRIGILDRGAAHHALRPRPPYTAFSVMTLSM
jgi:hypothetical protein